MTEDGELQAIYEITDFMRSIVDKFKNYSNDAFYKALVLLHKYFRMFSLRNSKYDRYLIGTTCLLLASKIEDRPVKLADLTVLHHRTGLSKQKWPEEPMNEKQRSLLQAKISEIESEILRQIGYDFDIDLPYKYIRKYNEYPEYNIKKIVKVAEWFCNDTFLRPLCLFYHPMHIAIGCIYFALLFFKQTLPAHNEMPWYKFLHPDIKPEHVHSIGEEIKQIYQKMELQKRQFDSRYMKTDKVESIGNKTLYKKTL
jgi:cyclin T